MNAYNNLANAIIIQACKDYRESKAIVNKKDGNYNRETIKKARNTILEIEEFFRGDWIKILTKADGEDILNRLKNEVSR